MSPLPKNNFFVIDLYNLIYRMFYAVPPMTLRDGTPIHAVYGVAKFLKSLWEDGQTHHLVIASDVGASFRVDISPTYKWTRDRMPDDLRTQIDMIHSLISTLGIPVYSQSGYEADDIIGTLAVLQKTQLADTQVVIISSDKDLCQFVHDGHVHIYDAMKQKFLREKEVHEKFGVPTTQVCDYLAIVGDTSDNIPGIAGFGPKKAGDLLSTYESLAGIYKSIWIDEYTLQSTPYIPTYDTAVYARSPLSEKVKQTLLDNVHNAFLSYQLASIVTDLDIDLDISSTVYAQRDFWTPAVIDIFTQYEFVSLLPARYRTARVEKKISTESIYIDTTAGIDGLVAHIQTEKSMYIATTGRGMYLSALAVHTGGTVYSIDISTVDIVPLLQYIQTADIHIHGYDLVADIARLQAYQKPPVGTGGQVGMF